MNELPRYLFVDKGQYLGKSGEDIRNLLLVEQPDGSWRELSGKELWEFQGRHPNFLRELRTEMEYEESMEQETVAEHEARMRVLESILDPFSALRSRLTKRNVKPITS